MAQRVPAKIPPKKRTKTVRTPVPLTYFPFIGLEQESFKQFFPDGGIKTDNARVVKKHKRPLD